MVIKFYSSTPILAKPKKYLKQPPVISVLLFSQSSQENMCGHRGLELDSDLQVYEISLTQQFRNHYEKIFGQLNDGPTLPVGVANRRGEK